jgi:hypothetical protein
MPPPDSAAMRKDSFMTEAKALWVQTRKEVAKEECTKHRMWRSTADVAAECRIEWERGTAHKRHRLQPRT